MREDVDLDSGVVNIRYSKGHAQHYVVLHDSMLLLMRQYDGVIDKMYPERVYFFPARKRNGRLPQSILGAAEFQQNVASV